MQVRFGEIFKIPLQNNRWNLFDEGTGPNSEQGWVGDNSEFAAYPERDADGDSLVIRTNTKPHEDGTRYNIINEVLPEFEGLLEREEPNFFRKVLAFVDAQVAEAVKKNQRVL